MTTPLPTRAVRCAIYTRKSSAEGLDQQFNSLHAQREACASYIASQRLEGWSAIATGYDDGGFSGGTLERPALASLLSDIDAGLVDILVVYKIDRLSRSLRDFVHLVERMERKGVTFVAVTQAFNTTTSTGRLMLNVLLSFAQFERELASDRLKDKFAASRARGLWVHGARPLGYQVEELRLVVDEAEAALVRYMFRRYPQVGSARQLAREMNMRGWLNHKGRPLRGSYIVNHLNNRLYRGELVHYGKSLPGQHEALVTESAWRKAQKALVKSRARLKALRPHPVGGMLKGMLFSPTGHVMVHSFVYGRNKRVFRYYLSAAVNRYGPGSSPSGRFRAGELEASVESTLDRLAARSDLTGLGMVEADLVVKERTYAEATGRVRRLVRKVDIGLDDMTLTFHTGVAVRAPFAGRIGGPPASRDGTFAHAHRSARWNRAEGRAAS